MAALTYLEVIVEPVKIVGKEVADKGVYTCTIEGTDFRKSLNDTDKLSVSMLKTFYRSIRSQLMDRIKSIVPSTNDLHKEIESRMRRLN